MILGGVSLNQNQRLSNRKIENEKEKLKEKKKKKIAKRSMTHIMNDIIRNGITFYLSAFQVNFR